MPAEKLIALVMDLRFDPCCLPDLEIMAPGDDTLEKKNYERTDAGAFAGGSPDRLRDIYRETFKELAVEAVEEAGKE